MTDANTSAVKERYGKLAETSCCLSCGGAMERGKAMPGEVVVDLGSGRGRDCKRAALAVGDEGHVYGIDATDEMIFRATKEAAKMDVRNVEFLKCDLADIALADETANLVTSNCTINHATDKDAVWREVHRILKPGGRFVVSDIYATEEVSEEYRTDPDRVAECWAGAVTRDVYMDALERAGFENIEILEESAPYEKGRIVVASFTVSGTRALAKKCGSGCCCA